MEDRHARQRAFLGADAHDRIREARVLVAGLGGLGCPAAQALAGAGVAVLGLVDGDDVEASNLHRQPLYTVADIGLPKVEAAARRLREQNPEVELRPLAAWVTAQGARDLLWGYDIVLSCTDDAEARLALNDACRQARIPLVHAAVAGWEGELMVVLPEGPCLRCVRPVAAEAPTCAEEGILGPVPNLLGLLQASEALKLAAGSPVQAGRLTLIDLQALDLTHVNVEERPSCGHGVSMPLACPAPWAAPPSPDISVADYEARKGEFVTVDVREQDEFDEVHIPGSRLIPLHELTERLAELPRDVKLVCVCSVGGRSGRATMILREHGYQALNLRGGMRAWLSR